MILNCKLKVVTRPHVEEDGGGGEKYERICDGCISGGVIETSYIDLNIHVFFLSIYVSS
jgi:hypothetical protein